MKNKYYVYEGTVTKEYNNYMEMAIDILESHPIGIKYIQSIDCAKIDVMPFDLSKFNYDVEMGD